MHIQKNSKKVAVIGSGFGGLAAAIRLQAHGFDTTIYEQRDLPGGRAYRYEMDGFKFDAGPTVVTAPDTLEELFALAGKSMSSYVDLIEVDPFYRLYWEDGFVFDYTKDNDKLMQQIANVSEKDAAGYLNFLEYAEKVYKAGYEELCHVPFLEFKDMIKVSPQLLALGAYNSVYKTVAKHVQDEHLRQAFTFNSLLIGGNPFRASSIYTLIHPLEKKMGVWFPKGGTHALVQGLVKLFTDIGGQIEYNAPIEQIVTDNSDVKGVVVNGQKVGYDMVVSNADVTYTYKNLLSETPAVERARKKLERSDYSMSLFLIYFGTNRQFPELAHHNIFFGNRYKELLTDIFDRGVLADDFSLYLHVPSKSDPGLAPEGKEAFYVLTPVPHLGKYSPDWSKIGPDYANKILTYLDEKYVPGLKSSIEVQKIFTPDDFSSQLNAHVGSAFSLEPTLTQSAWFRVHNRDKRIGGLYFVGAGTHPGAGIPGVVGSAKATMSVILDDYKVAGGKDSMSTAKKDAEAVWRAKFAQA